MAQILGDKYEVADVELSAGEPALQNVDILLVAGPKKRLNDAELFSIDQFIMRGGQAMLLVDRNDIDMTTFIGRPNDTGLSDLVETYGARIRPDLVLDEMNQQVALMKQQGNVRFQSYVRFPLFIRVQDLASDNPLVKNLHDLTLPFITPDRRARPRGRHRGRDRAQLAEDVAF
ncbi:MAG: GldG family protein [Deltaproteobacteria bacterium]|nr:GldG family protein [Deltaproteobacteria bacterium]